MRHTNAGNSSTPLASVSPVVLVLLFAAALVCTPYVARADNVIVVPDGSYTIHPFNAPSLVLDGSAGSGQPAVLASAAASGQTRAISSMGQYCEIKLPGNLVLTIADPTGANMSKILVTPDTGADTQIWAIVSNGTNTFNIIPKLAPSSGADNFMGATTPGPSVDLFGNSGNDPHLQWAITSGGH